MESVVVRGLTIGTGRPKIIVPVLGETLDALFGEAAQVKTPPADLAEWRVDWFDGWADRERLLEAAAALRERLGELPILATFRTAREGGHQAITGAEYAALVTALAESGQVDLIDLEAFFPEAPIERLVRLCRSAGVKTVLSSHDFQKTPPKQELIARLTYMEELGADLSKLAVMPRDPGDVLNLLQATWERSRQAARPLVTMSMGALGAVSRLSGELFGSALTFGCAARASAPGQIEAQALANTLELLRLE